MYHAFVGFRRSLRRSSLTFRYVSWATVVLSGRRLAQHLLQVRDRGIGVDLLEDLVAALVGDHLRHPARRVHEVAEVDRSRRAGLLARRHDVSVAGVPSLVLRP